MDYNEFSWERQQAQASAVSLSPEDIQTIARLMVELREVTLSRASYRAATAFLKQFGVDVDCASLVVPEQVAH